jgi:60 kDa SS-A/Ro ribonucleoprotein
MEGSMSMSGYVAAVASSTQTESARADQVPNSAGGYVFAVDDWTRLARFLILGSDAPTYYATARELTRENASCVLRCLAAGRAPRNDPAIFALALALKHGDEATRRAAGIAVARVCRIGTHLFHLAEALRHVGDKRGWGSIVRRSVGAWYTERSPEALAGQLIKYQSRDGWSHRDVLRLARPKAEGVGNDLLRWAVRGWPGIGTEPHPDPVLRTIWAFEAAHRATNPKEIIRLIGDYGLPRECVPTEFLNSADVWLALLRGSGDGMPLAAMVRNLGKMTAVGLLTPLSVATAFVCERLADAAALAASRVHPLSLLIARGIYAQGHGDKGSLVWSPDASIVAALERAFYAAFANVVPSGRRTMVALDVSGSMGVPLGGAGALSVREAAAAMALVTIRSEPKTMTVGFTSPSGRNVMSRQDRTALTILPFGAGTTLGEAIGVTGNLPFGATDCSLPMRVAQQEGWPVETFIVLTDNETWRGDVHPFQALRSYREATGIAAKLIVVGMTSTGFSIADPTDAGMLDVVGFDAAAPAVMADFSRGEA